MLVVGLTGGIASGKSTVAAEFSALGISIIDTDQISRDIVSPQTEGYQKVIDLFGPGIVAADGALDRDLMRTRVFADPSLRRQLESTLHPLILREVREQLRRIATPYCVVAIPLLLEAGWAGEVDRILVVDCSETQQRSRLSGRPGMSPALIDQILASQVDRATRLQAADDIVDNSSEPNALPAQIAALHQKYLALSSGVTTPNHRH